MHRAGAFFVTRAKSNLKAHRLYSAPVDRATGIICDQTIALDGHSTRADYPERLRRIRFNDAETGKTLVFLTNHFELPALTIAALYKNPLAGGTFLQVDQATPAHQAVLRNLRERGEDPNLDRSLGLRVGGDHQKAPRFGGVSLHIDAGPFGDNIRKNADPDSALGGNVPMQYCNRK
jgi:hypothetical protein